MARKTKDADAPTADTAPAKFHPDTLGLLTELESVVKINAISLSAEDRLNTGLLVADLLLGGGLCPGMYTFFGPEQSAKTTLAITMLGASVKQNVDLRVLWDAENSSGSSAPYINNIFRTGGVSTRVDQLFGARQDGRFKDAPLVYYRDDYELEKVFNWLSGLQRRLPDKRHEDGQWWYVYGDDAKTKAKLGSAIDAKMTRLQSSGLWIPAEDGRLQAIILVDSWPALVPASLDDDEGDNSIALAARAFSRHVPRIKGALRSKRIALIGINQLRKNPMAMYGPKEIEPCGEALKYNSDVRIRLYPRGSGMPGNPSLDKGIEFEPSVEHPNCQDRYRYINLQGHKNKLSVPGREVWARLWVEDGHSEARGFDPVWDAWHFGMLTGQLSGKRSAIRLNIRGLQPAEKVLKWTDFKNLILGDRATRQAICDGIGYPTLDLRAGFLKQIRNGTAEKLYSEAQRGKVKAEEDD